MTELVKVALITSIPGAISAIGVILNHFGIQNVVRNTDGINNRLQRQVETQETDALHLAEITENKREIAELTKKLNGGSHDT